MLYGHTSSLGPLFSAEAVRVNKGVHEGVACGSNRKGLTMADNLTPTAERVLALRPQDPKRFLPPEQLYLLESLTKQVALALEVERLVGSDVPH
jgi:hypothetical protein